MDRETQRDPPYPGRCYNCGGFGHFWRECNRYRQRRPWNTRGDRRMPEGHRREEAVPESTAQGKLDVTSSGDHDRRRCSWAPFVDSLPATPPPLQLAAIITASSVNGRRRHSRKGKRRQRDIVRKTPGHALKPDLDIWFSGAGGDWGDGEGEIYTALKTLRVRH
ncbi:hypothetical protein MTO96_052305 [Rhipicephalus appendiculatus]